MSATAPRTWRLDGPAHRYPRESRERSDSPTRRTRRHSLGRGLLHARRVPGCTQSANERRGRVSNWRSHDTRLGRGSTWQGVTPRRRQAACCVGSQHAVTLYRAGLARRPRRGHVLPCVRSEVVRRSDLIAVVECEHATGKDVVPVVLMVKELRLGCSRQLHLNRHQRSVSRRTGRGDSVRLNSLWGFARHRHPPEETPAGGGDEPLW